ncbi:MAG TPA: thiamine-phosphate kinase [Flavobacteriales bacterium]|jgi:thiamine-monophosphate kinase|nr:thiamine-phosphate kinase [Salibacteraceae bacterium]HAS36737.1 thiamine-phosphate kinase [Flavobacteriales bacterium]
MEDRTELSSLGEFALIQRLIGTFTNEQDSTIKGVGDDAAVIGSGEMKTVISTDQLIEGIHFDLSYMPLKHLGYKAVAVNLSDILAMNVVPSQIMVSIAASNRFSVEALEELYLGIRTCCEVYKVDMVGGDTSSSTSGLVINITAIGFEKEDKIVYRSGSKEGDLICLSGDLGGAYVGLQLLEREKSVFKENPEIQPELDGHDYVLERQLKPEPRFDVVRQLATIGVKPTSMIDVSDGLSSELFHLGKSASLGATIYEDKVPIDPATMLASEELKMDGLTSALNGGEDYELLFTIDQSDFEKIKDEKDIHIIGHMTDQGFHLVNNVGQQIELKAQGWKAFESS